MHKVTRILAVGAGFVILSGCNFQNRFLYHPGEETIADVRQYAAENHLQMWPDSNPGYRGIVSQKGPAFFKGTVIVFHGNAGPAASRKHYFAPLEDRGYRVVLAEYPGYGGRSGEMSENSFVYDARQTAARARQEFGGPLYVWGESLGCGIASGVATDETIRPKGVVMLTPWDSLRNEAKAKFPWLPVSLFLSDKYDNVVNLAKYRGPVAVIMAGKDEVIPNRLTKRLYDSLSRPKRMWLFENAGHNNWPADPALGWWDEVMKFVERSQD
ncbi:MAG TPA: alpha/beta fold hydrolase [Thermodesulfobacteriota bacterium]|nr:alpha/beta fold hydrolase [Thermodesulfobacteriota bacterium]